MRSFRTGQLLAAFALACISTSVQAAKLAEVTYFDTEAQQVGIPTFNPQLGHLAKVEVAVKAIKYRLWQIFSPTFANQTISVGWSIDSIYQVYAFGGGQTVLSGQNFETFSLSGSGTETVTFDADGYGQFETKLAGSKTFKINKDAVIRTDQFTYFIVTGDDMGFYDNSNDKISLDLPDGLSAHQITAGCGFQGSYGDDFCGSVGYTVTYSYNPPSAVPESSTWVLMILGFGLVGLALRHSKFRQKQFVPA